MTGLEEWIERKASAAAYQVSLGNWAQAREQVESTSVYSVDTADIAALRAETIEKLRGQIGVDKEVVIEILHPLIEAIRGAEPTSEAKNLQMGQPFERDHSTNLKT